MGYSPWGCKKGDTTKLTLHVLTVFPRDIKLITGQLGLGYSAFSERGQLVKLHSWEAACGWG